MDIAKMVAQDTIVRIDKNKKFTVFYQEQAVATGEIRSDETLCGFEDRNNNMFDVVIRMVDGAYKAELAQVFMGLTLDKSASYEISVAAEKADGQFCQLPGREGCPGYVIAAAVYTVFAVENAVVCHQHLQQRDASPVGRETMATAIDGGGSVAHPTLLITALNAAGSTGGIVLCRICKYFQFIHQFHKLHQKQMFYYLLCII